MVQFISLTRLTRLIRNYETFDLMKNIMQNFHLELQRILLSIQMVFYGVFILWKFITQSLDEPERQIIHFFAYNCLAEGLCLLLKESIQYSAKHITFYEPFHYGNKFWNLLKENVKVKNLWVNTKTIRREQEIYRIMNKNMYFKAYSTWNST